MLKNASISRIFYKILLRSEQFKILEEIIMAITASMVKELREMTGAGMMDCKKALTETNGDMDAAVDVLKKSGAAKMAKKASRIAAEGITRVAFNDNEVVVAEVEEVEVAEEA